MSVALALDIPGPSALLNKPATLALGLVTFALRALCVDDAPGWNARSAMIDPAIDAASADTAFDRASRLVRLGANMSRLIFLAKMCAVVLSRDDWYTSDPSLVRP